LKYQISVEGWVFEIEITPDGQVWVDNQLLNVDLESIDGLPLYSLLVDHRSYEAHVETEENGDSLVAIAGRPFRITMEDKVQGLKDNSKPRLAHAPLEIKAPLPGCLVKVPVAEGEQVEEGDIVAVMESMKMHMILRMPQTGVIRSLNAKAGQEVAQGEVLAIIEAFQAEANRE
jgi:biotin carboxyl carrier protein